MCVYERQREREHVNQSDLKEPVALDDMGYRDGFVVLKQMFTGVGGMKG